MSDTATPMMKQYRSIRNSLPDDTLLFYRLGDFYEMFFDDAKDAARILEINLTKRNKIPMCGFPYHAAPGYLAKVIRAGKKVAICEQVEDPSTAKGIVKREVTRVITPGTVLEENVLDAAQNNYLAAICKHEKGFGLAWLDLSTGEFCIEEAADIESVLNSLARQRPAECLIPEEDRDTPDYELLHANPSGTLFTPHDDWTFELDAATDTLTRHFKVHSLKGFGCDDYPAGVCAAGAVLHYVTKELRNEVGHIRQLRRVNASDHMLLDEDTILNLDLVASRAPGPAASAATLLRVLDTTRTAMGGRLIRSWILRPLIRHDLIVNRHDAVETLTKTRSELQGLRDVLGDIRDLERLIARLGSRSGNARDLRSVCRSLEAMPKVKEILAALGAPLLNELAEAVSPLPDLQELMDAAIAEEPPLTIKEGGLIREGYNAKLDELRSAASDGKKWIAEFQAREQERTGIKNLKIRHNKVFGYYIEITKSNLAEVPEDYDRKQTLVNAERFITPELKEYEEKILGAEDKSVDLEYTLFVEIRDAAVRETEAIQRTADALGQADVLATFAERALALRYVRPTMTEGDKIAIQDGRHPVVEEIMEAEPFVPNDTKLDNTENQLMIITGPNMAGKSTYIRQVALISIIAQIGSFVPAREAEIAIVDRVFTRVGASDDLARGRSTFMVEMQESANILNNATPKSLIVLDEIGRGTSTFDGISIAWAVAEYLHNNPKVKAKTLFATHYHELTDLAITLPGVKNYSVLVREKNDQIAFLRKIVAGAADKSYGIQVARLAGLPAPVIERAKEVLSNLEEGEFGETGQPKIAQQRPRKSKNDPDQLSLFGE